MIVAEVDGRRTELILDSGASGLVLFGAARAGNTTNLMTNAGSMMVGTYTARFTLEGGRERRLSAALVDAQNAPGLLPLSAF